MGYPKYTTAKGVIRFAHLNTPDTKFNPEGEYTARVQYELNARSTKALTDFLESQLDEIVKETKKKKKRPNEERCWKTSDDGKFLEVLFKQKCKDWMEGKNPILFYAANGDPLNKPPQVKSGSEVRVFFIVRPYDVSGRQGLSLTPKGVQIIKLSEGNWTAEAMGFGKEDGYTQEESGFDEYTETEEDMHGMEDDDEF